MPETLRSSILDSASVSPEQRFVECLFPDGTQQTLTYREIVNRGSQFARECTNLGLAPGAVVLVILPHSSDLYAAFFGAVLGGLVPSILAAPSFKLNPAHYREELQALLERIGARAIVTDSSTAGQLGADGGRLGLAGVILADRLLAAAVEVPEVSVAPEDIALLQHSSGSTGLKKGVALSNASVLRQIADYQSALHISARDHIASWLPLYHDMGLIACCVLPMVARIPVTALSPLHWVTRPSSLLHAISRNRCTLAWMPNFAYEFLATRIRQSEMGTLRLDSVRGWINCAEPTTARAHRRFLAKFRERGVRPEALWTCYAMAETTFAVSQSSDTDMPRIEQVDRETFQRDRQALPVESGVEPTLEMMSGGRPIPGTEIRIVDEGGADLRDRHVGEIVIRSASMFSGYFGDQSSTEKVLQDGWYYSGDLGYMATGHLFVTGRRKDLIIIAGKNYYPQDIERIVSTVEGIHPGRVVALGHDDPSLGTQRLVVLAEIEADLRLGDHDLADRVRGTLAGELDCVIDDLRLVPHMWLLKTSSGKIARAPNLQRYLEVFGAPWVAPPSTE